MDLSKCRILVTSTSYGRGGRNLRELLRGSCGEVIFNETGKPLKADALADALRDIDGYIAGVDEISAEALESANRLKVISRYGVGVDNVDLQAARRLGIVVTNTPGANSVSVAELTIGLILALLRNIPDAVVATRAGEWPRMTGASLRNKTVGIVGLGAVGRNVARRLLAFDCALLAYDPYVESPTEGVLKVSLEELLERSDVVSLHLPATEESRGMANETFFGRMKPGAFLVNTARGELIVESALLDAIEGGRLKGAALDVFEQEPLPQDSPLLHTHGILVTPHTASHSDDAIDAMGEMATEDCLAVLRGERPKHPVVV